MSSHCPECGTWLEGLPEEFSSDPFPCPACSTMIEWEWDYIEGDPSFWLIKSTAKGSPQGLPEVSGDLMHNPADYGSRMPVMVFSPYSDPNPENFERNKVYALKAVMDSFNRGEAPLAPHVFFTTVLDQDGTKQEERNIGMEASVAWASVAKKAIFYVDHGQSSGMAWEYQFCLDNDIPVEFRYILSELQHQ